MNFFQLECFVMAVEKGSFAEVASSLHVTQPTITYQITNLEEELEEKLFSRTKRGVTVTRAGKLFYKDACGILENYHHALQHFRHAVSLPETVIRVGFTRYPDNYDIFAAIHRYRAQYPDTIVDVIQDEMVSDGDDTPCDILLHYRYDPDEYADFAYVPLGRCPYYVLVSQYSPLAEKESLTLEDLRGLRMLTMDELKNTRFQVPSLRTLKKAGIEVGLYNNLDQLMYAIADGVGFGVFPAKYREVKTGFKRVRLRSQKPLEYGLLYREEHSAAVENLLQFLVEALKEKTAED